MSPISFQDNLEKNLKRDTYFNSNEVASAASSGYTPLDAINQTTQLFQSALSQGLVIDGLDPVSFMLKKIDSYDIKKEIEQIKKLLENEDKSTNPQIAPKKHEEIIATLNDFQELCNKDDDGRAFKEHLKQEFVKSAKSALNGKGLDNPACRRIAEYEIAQEMVSTLEKPLLFANSEHTLQNFNHNVETDLRLNTTSAKALAERLNTTVATYGKNVTIEGLLSSIAQNHKEAIGEDFLKNVKKDVNDNLEPKILDAIFHTKKINSKDPIVFALENGITIKEMDPMRFALDNNIPINKQPAMNYALKYDVSVDEKNPCIEKLQQLSGADIKEFDRFIKDNNLYDLLKPSEKTNNPAIEKAKELIAVTKLDSLINSADASLPEIKGAENLKKAVAKFVEDVSTVLVDTGQINKDQKDSHIIKTDELIKEIDHSNKNTLKESFLSVATKILETFGLKSLAKKVADKVADGKEARLQKTVGIIRDTVKGKVATTLPSSWPPHNNKDNKQKSI